MTLLSAVAPIDETPIDRYLAAQADLTAVERFAQRHEAEMVPRQARYYRDLLPVTRPEPGQQYGFEVDLDACTGCKACVAACHSLNGLDDDESWRSVTLITGGSPAQPFQQTVTSACHHCVDPACLTGCPVDAYDKDPVTGIVAHLDDQCIGCGYCTLTCPYEVPVFNHDRGIVRKCDMCTGRLAVGEAPACVQACPNGAIAIKVVDIAAAMTEARLGALVPGGPPSAITTPTTVYRSAKGRLADRAVGSSSPGGPSPAGPARAHTPLAVMLVLTQLSVGTFVIDYGRRMMSNGSAVGPFDAVLAAAAGVLALAASVLHLGRPRYFYRAVIGFGHSWLSREVVAFGAFTGLATLYAVLLTLRWPAVGVVRAVVGGSAAVSGLVGVACSVMIYAVTHRSSWRPATVTAKFALTTVTCGLAALLWASFVTSAAPGARRNIALLLGAVMLVKLAGEAAVFRHLPGRRNPEGRRRARLLQRELRTTTGLRFGAGLVGGVALPLALGGGAGAGPMPGGFGFFIVTLVLAGVVAGELLERSLFFTTASPPQ